MQRFTDEDPRSLLSAFSTLASLIAKSVWDLFPGGFLSREGPSCSEELDCYPQYCLSGVLYTHLCRLGALLERKRNTVTRGGRK